MTNLFSLLRRNADSAYGDRECLVSGSERFTWRDLLRGVVALASELKNVGVGRGDVVAIHLGHNYLSVSSILAVNALGGIFLVVPPALKANQITHQLALSDCKFIIGGENLNDEIVLLCRTREIVRISDVSVKMWVDRYLLDSSYQIDGAGMGESIPSDPFSIIFTSGSTGLPKGVLVPQRTILEGARIVSSYLKLGSEDRILSFLPFSFDYGFNQLASVIFNGSCIVLHDYILPTGLLDQIEKEKITGFATVPALWKSFRSAKISKNPTLKKIGTLRYITTAGGAHPADLVRYLESSFPKIKIYIMYGLTESFRSTFLEPKFFGSKIGSIGKPVPEVEILIFDENDNPIEEPGKIGELVHRGAFVNYGYLNDRFANEQKFIQRFPINLFSSLPETLVRSGDLVSRDHDGFLFFHGRKDQMIKRQGYRISPTEIEMAMARVPGVVCSAVSSTSPEAGDQDVILFYELSEDLPEKSILNSLRESLPPYALPSRLFEVEEWIHTSSGKIDVRAMMALYDI